MAFLHSLKGTDQNIAFFKSIAQLRRSLHRPVPAPIYLTDEASGISLAIHVHDFDCNRVISRFFGPITCFVSNLLMSHKKSMNFTEIIQ